ncbi:probable serine/threonine-protein kinase SIS8 isoform X3 [Magnolia sinica]|uniref:probable serine/threonine-protein kinase SIS8 isoform X3 n=1 Tax=Magnolia sinica TaxID=86752 RepID=UPI00265984BB|nr:probable serine/threonine-protein kinase SIS8 isoform X3 [Magnolia sinica]
MMRNILKKLHIMPAQSEEGPSSSSGKVSPSRLSLSPPHRHHLEQKPLSGLSGWLNSVTGRHSSSPPLSSGRGDRNDPMDSPGSGSLGGLDVALLDVARQDADESAVRNPEMEEEYQIQLALELSVKEDPEAVQIEAVKQISLGSCPPQNTPGEVLAYRYWNYNALGYDDKILDGFYDLYGILADSTSEMPSLIDLQQIPVSDSISWEAVLVNRVADGDLSKLEQRALVMAVESRSGSTGFKGNDLVQKLAALVADYMGGPVGDPEKMLKAWRNLSNHLRASVGNMVLPLGQLKIGLARHRALLFKVLADSVGVPCQLVKGHQYTGSDDVAVNIIKINDDGRDREYIVDLMAAPGTLIPSDAAGPQMEYEDPLFEVSPVCRDVDSSHIASSSTSNGVSSSIGDSPEFAPLDKKSRSKNLATIESSLDNRCSSDEFSGQENLRPRSSRKESSSRGLYSDSPNEKSQVHETTSRPSPYMHARFPSWTEGVSSPAAHRMKVKDVSQYMIDAAKENPQLAQKLHDVLLESGVVAPPNLFTEIYAPAAEDKNQTGDANEKKLRKNGTRHKARADVGPARYLPPLPHHGIQSKVNPYRMQMEQLEGSPTSSQSEASATLTQETSSPVKFVKHVPVAAAAATAAVVASSMLVAAAKSSADSNLEVPVAAAATATAAAVVATTAAVTRQYEQLESCAHLPSADAFVNQINYRQKDGEGDDIGNEPRGSDHRQAGGDKQEPDASGTHPEGERISDKSTGNDSARSEAALDEVAEWEVSWEEITLGERIGLGSYGEVYRGDWNGTEVAVKKFLDQDISGDALAEFISEVQIMKRLRHPNVVLFMGAVTRAPHLSIVTEFLPRGSLYRIIHRPNNQLDERRRLKMSLDVARGMNYLHNFKPVIVHRDLKSPNLLVDKNWNVKVCDFGLSRMKHNTFLSSRSTAGTCFKYQRYRPIYPTIYLVSHLCDTKCIGCANKSHLFDTVSIFDFDPLFFFAVYHVKSVSNGYKYMILHVFHEKSWIWSFGF